MIRNTETSYGLVAILLHWLMALGVFGLFGLGLYMVDLSYYDSWYRGSLSLHKSIGLFLAALLVLRIVWRQCNVRPADEPGQRWEQIVSHLTHTLLYVLMLSLMLSGYLISTADGRGIEVFELFEVPALPWAIDQQEDLAGLIHEYLAWSIIGLASVHALAALKHHFVNRDAVLKRMLRPIKSNS